jgi:predicted nucleic acid-binding protein
MAYRVFVDADVLIAAFQGERQLRDCAQAILSQQLFEFWYNPLLRMEVTVQPAYHKHTSELSFYNTYFSGAQCYGDLNRMFEVGHIEAAKHGIAVVDALHVATAHLAKCAVLVTAERDTKPMFRTRLVKVVSILGMSKTASTVHKLLS